MVWIKRTFHCVSQNTGSYENDRFGPNFDGRQTKM